MSVIENLAETNGKEEIDETLGGKAFPGLWRWCGDWKAQQMHAQ